MKNKSNALGQSVPFQNNFLADSRSPSPALFAKDQKQNFQTNGQLPNVHQDEFSKNYLKPNGNLNGRISNSYYK